MIEKRCQWSVVSDQLKKAEHFLCFIILLATCYLLLATCCFAGEPPAVITSDTLEYNKATSTYIAKGSAKLKQGDKLIEAREMRYNEKTADVFAEGDVKYNDREILLKAEKAKYNLNTKTGIFYNAEIFSKNDNLHVFGTVVEKRGEHEYFLKKASMTTCDAPSPAWCFRGRDVDITVGERLTAKDATFRVDGLPVLYTPYLSAPIYTERRTGFLLPVIGLYRTKGFYYRQPFYWNIAENRDATFMLDWYSKRGIGEGVEYRYIAPGNVSGRDWFYHISDHELNKDFYELRSTHEKRDPDGLSTYLNLNLLEGKEFYREYRTRDERIMRFTESTGEIYLPLQNSRLYVMSQYLQDLKDESEFSTVIQRLPEIGYTVHPGRIGPVVFSLTSAASNFWRDEGVFGQRLDIHPEVSYSFGDKIVFFQNLGLRETAYWLHRSDQQDDFGSSPHRDIFDYNITATSRLTRDYGSFVHIIEPSLSYTYIPWVKRDKTNLPLFDSTDLISRQSVFGLSFINRLTDEKGEFLTLKLSGSYDTYAKANPLTLEASLARPVYLRGDVLYNVNTGRIEIANWDAAVKLSKATVSAGERHDLINNVEVYNLGLNYIYSKNLSAELKLWYDAKGGAVSDTQFNVKYQQQCWGVTIIFDKKPGDYGVRVMFNLLGLGSFKA